MPALQILAQLIGITVVLSGWGFLVTWIIGRTIHQEADSFGWFESAILGTSGAYVYAAITAMVFPLRGVVDLLFAAAGLAGFVAALIHRKQRTPWIAFAGAACLFALAAAGTVHVALNYDAGLYYLQYARTLETDGLIPGLANVHDRFGFNSAVVPLSAVFRGPIFGPDGLFLVGPALFLVFTGAALELAARGFRKRRFEAAHFVALIAIGLWLVVFNQTVLSWFGLSPSGDLAAAAAVLYCPVPMLALFRAAAVEDDEACRRYAILLAAASGFAIASKLAAAPVALLMLVPSMVLRRQRSSHVALVLFAVILSVWMLYSLLLSGCLLYPLSGTCVAWLPWAPDTATVESAGAAIRAWARAPGESIDSALQGWGWIASWRRNMLPYREFVFTLLHALPYVAAFLIVARFAFRTTGANSQSKLGTHAVLAAWAANVAGLAFWFFSAPDPRFGLGFILGTVACTGALLLTVNAAYPLSEGRARWFAGVVSITFVALLLNDARLLADAPSGMPAMAWRSLPAPATRPMTNGQGLTLAVPLQGDQCWEVETLCTPRIAPALMKTTLLGRPLFTLRGHAAFRPVTPVDAAPSALTLPGNPVRFGPGVPGPEQTTRGGEVFQVRWLMQRSEFTVVHDGPPRRVKIGIRIASHRAERQVWLEQDGKALPARVTVRSTFWEGGDALLENAATLHAGENRFAITTTGDAVDVTPGRPVYLLLVGGVTLKDDVAN